MERGVGSQLSYLNKIWYSDEENADYGNKVETDSGRIIILILRTLVFPNKSDYAPAP